MVNKDQVRYPVSTFRIVPSLLHGATIIYRRCPVVEYISYQIHGIADIGIIVTVGISGTDRVRSRASVENVSDHEHSIADIRFSVTVGITADGLTGITDTIIIVIGLIGISQFGAIITAIGNTVFVEIGVIVETFAYIASVRDPVFIGVDGVIVSGADIARVSKAVVIVINLVGVCNIDAVITAIGNAVLIGVIIIGITGAEVTFIAAAIPVKIQLQDVVNFRAVITDIPYAVAVEISLVFIIVIGAVISTSHVRIAVVVIISEFKHNLIGKKIYSAILVLRNQDQTQISPCPSTVGLSKQG
jgi:hypothetical protein